MRIHPGGPVPALLLLPDGASDQYPQAAIYDDAGILLTTLDLLHVANGLYAPASAYLMPDRSFVSVVYIVYSDSGHISESDIYQRDLDVFYQVNSASVWAAILETGYTGAQIMSFMVAALAGKVSGAGTSEVTIKGLDGTTTRILATVDAAGNRSAVVLTP